MRSSQSSTMKQTILDGDTPYLPQEIIRNILTRIPVKPLIRLQSVCKNWKNLIKTPSFIADHLHQPAHHNRCLLFQRSGRSCGVSLNLFLFDCEKQLHEVHNPPEMGSLPCGRIVSSSNGLILYVKSSRYGGVLSFFLWNPAIRKIKQVSRKKYDFDGNFYIGFGYSPIVDDYKTLVAYVPEGGDEVDQVEVYSLSTQRWKQIEFRNLEGVYLCSETITANGAMFWRGSTFVMKDCQYPFGLVVAFDIAMETFTLIPLPALESNSKDKLTVHENKLGVITLTRESKPFSMDIYLIDLWVLDEGIGASRERWSWTKKFSIRRTFLDSPVPLGFWGMDPLCIWGDELVCNTNDWTKKFSIRRTSLGLPVPLDFWGMDPLGILRDEFVCNTNDMSGHGETEREDNTELITSLSLLNLRTNELKKIATSRCGNEFSIIFNHEESLVPVDSIHMEEA